MKYTVFKEYLLMSINKPTVVYSHASPVLLLQITIDGRQLRGDGSKPFFLTRSSQQRKEGAPGPSTSANQSLVGVEVYAIEYYMTKKGWPCAVHAENSTFSTLYALLMWDIIFSPVPDVFRAPMQVSWTIC
jgi:hypothetical protein